MKKKKLVRKGKKSARGKKVSAKSEKQGTPFGALRKVDVSDISHRVGVERTLDEENPEDKRFLDSIKATGGPRIPVALQENDDGDYEVAFGNRRVDACRELGIEQVIALVYKAGISDQEILRDQVLENDERKSWSQFERAEVYEELVEELDSQTEAANFLRISKQELSDILNVLNIDSDVRDSIDEHQREAVVNGTKPLSDTHITEIAKGGSPEEQEEALELAKSGETSKGLRKARKPKRPKKTSEPDPMGGGKSGAEDGNDPDGIPEDDLDDGGDEPDAGESDDGSDPQQDLDLDVETEKQDYRIRLGERDELMRSGVTWPTSEEVTECSQLANGVKVWMDSDQPFGAKRKVARLDWNGLRVKKGGVLVEYESGDFFVTLKGTEDKAYGLAVAIGFCLVRDFCEDYLKKGARAA